MKLLIYSDIKESFYGSQVPYLDYFSRFGHISIAPVFKRNSTLREINLFAQEELSKVDALIAPGGLDISSLSYGKAPDIMTGRTNQFFELWDKVLLRNALSIGVPVIGVCRGFQALGVALGGSMIQHLSYHKYSSPRGELVHDTFLTELGLDVVNKSVDRVTLSQLLKVPNKNQKAPSFETNSLHHQAVDTKDSQIDTLAYSLAADGFKKWIHIPEIISSKDGKAIGFQYHPEEMDCDIASGLIQKLLDNGTIYS